MSYLVAAEQIAADPALLAETRRLLPALERRATRKAGEPVSESGMTGTERVVAARFETYPQTNRSDAQWAAFWRDYHEACDGLPLSALEAGMKAWVRQPDAQFLPKPGKLRELALDAESPAIGAYTRARAAIRAADQRRDNPPPRAPLTDEEKADRQRLVEETLALLGRSKAA